MCFGAFGKAGCQVPVAAGELLSSHQLSPVLGERAGGRWVSETLPVFSVRAAPSLSHNLNNAFVRGGDVIPKVSAFGGEESINC